MKSSGKTVQAIVAKPSEAKALAEYFPCLKSKSSSKDLPSFNPLAESVVSGQHFYQLLKAIPLLILNLVENRTE